MAKAENLKNAQLKTQTADTSNFQNNAKVKKAQLLYEPWMDHQARTPSLHDYTDSPARFGKPKERSKYKFDKNYLNEFSITPDSRAGNVSDQGKNISKERISGEQMSKNKKLAPDNSANISRPSSEMSIKIHTPSRNDRRTPTPLPTYNELEKLKIEPDHRLRTMKNSNIVEMSTQTSRNSNLDQLKKNSLSYNNLHRSVSVLAVPQTLTIATSPFDFEIDIEDYTEFYAWLMNGHDDDIDPKLIERLLFQARKKIRK